MSELAKLKKQAIKLYHKSMDFDDLDCGRAVAEMLRPEIHTARITFGGVWKRVQELDPNAPANPFVEI